MGTVVLAVGLLAQAQFTQKQSIPADTFDVVQKGAETEKAEALTKSAQTAEQRLSEKEFVESFNALVKAMSTFSTRYKAEHVIDVKAVNSIKKAYRKLEDSEPWFSLKK